MTRPPASRAVLRLAMAGFSTFVAVACGAAAADDAAVRMSSSMRYDPAIIEIPVGGTVTWQNDGGREHTVTAVAEDGTPSGEFASGTVVGTGDYTHTFESAGEFPYHCEFHADEQMVGLVVVGP